MERRKEIKRMYSCKHVGLRDIKSEGGLSEGRKETCEKGGQEGRD